MAKLFSKSIGKAGLPPGTVVPLDRALAGPSRIKLIDYDAERLDEREATVDECIEHRDTPSVTWVNVDDLADAEKIQQLAKGFAVHPLCQEDIFQTGQRPKLDEYPDYTYIVVQMLYLHPDDMGIVSEQVSLVLGENFLLTFQEQPGDVFETIRQRIRNSRGRVREMGADYLCYALIDAIVDNYFLILETLSDQIEELDAEVSANPTPKTLRSVHAMKRQLMLLRRSVWPLRELISTLTRGESAVFRPETSLFLKDLYDHTVQIVETIEMLRDIISGLMDLYLSVVSNRMNEVMKVLTIIATIFIPITFIAGIYGMNFEYMPELKWSGGYFVVLGLMGAVALGMLYYFRRKHWL